MDGFTVLFHQASYGTVGLSTLQSRAFAGQIGETFIFCLPGSTGACRDGWDLVLGHELDSRYRPARSPGWSPACGSSSLEPSSTHVDDDGRARMVDVSGKEVTARSASAAGTLTCKPETLERFARGTAPKGAVMSHRRAGWNHGGQAHRRAHPAVPSRCR